MARYQPDDPAFAGDFIEFSDSWSRAQVRAAWDAIPDSTGIANLAAETAWLDVLRPKVIALHLSCVDAEPIVEPADLTPERTEQMDTRLYTWFGHAWIEHVNGLAELGNALGRQLRAMSAGSSQTPAA